MAFRKPLLAILLLLCVLSATSCGTFQSYSKWEDTRCFIYSGVRYDYEGPRRSGSGAASAAIAYALALEALFRWLDMPFSLVADTIALPATTVQCAVFRVTALEHAARQRPFLHGRELDDGDMRKLANMRDITDVFLTHSGVTDKGAARLGRMKHLRRLSLESTAVTGAAFSQWSDLRVLYSLNLSHSRIIPRNIALLEKLPALKQLYLGHVKLRDDDMKYVTRIRGLRVLGLERTGLSAAGFRRLRSLSELRFMNLEGLNLNKAAVDELVQFPTVRQLRLDHARIAFADLRRIAAQKNLKLIQLAAGQFPARELAVLKKINPGLRILTGTPGSYREFRP